MDACLTASGQWLLSGDGALEMFNAVTAVSLPRERKACPPKEHRIVMSMPATLGGLLLLAVPFHFSARVYTAIGGITRRQALIYGVYGIVNDDYQFP